jgi:hypothetical protein
MAHINKGLYQSIKRSNLEMSITETAMLQMFLQQCIIDGEGENKL